MDPIDRGQAGITGVANNIQDVTEIIGTEKVDLGFKAMIHTLAVSRTH